MFQISPSEILLCPHVRCIAVLDQARAFVREKLQGHFLADYAALGQTTDYRAVKLAIAEALAAGDVEATKIACRTWCKLVIGWTRAHTEKVAAYA